MRGARTGAAAGIRLSAAAARDYRAAVDHFSSAWTALLSAVAEVPDEDFQRPSGCRGWLVRDLVCHLVIDAQDVLITLATPADAEPTADDVTYWRLVGPPTGEDPLDALIPRLAAAYGEPGLLKFHLDDVGSAAGRAARLAARTGRVGTRGEVLTAGDYLAAYVLEATLHHLDLVAHLPSAAGPPSATLAVARTSLERIAGSPFPASLSDGDALLIGTGRRAPDAAEEAALGGLAARVPFILG
ncbi:Mycothiol maleylpyruvate isomerase N-terminal domain-containing protein [Streptomyces sp. WMMB 714]|nr:Mycothiol maleylpyruvate isomerase N-terminal domain-containing protein [Streptomyces sp. WMMB 714]